MDSKKVWQSAVARILSRKWDDLSAPDAVRKLAQEQRRNLSQNGRVNLDRICNELNVSLRYEPLRADALLQETESGYIAIVSSSTNKMRQRFSIAHELGHVVLYNATQLTQSFGHTSPAERKNSEAQEIEELCDCFAAELLLPLEHCRREIREGVSLRIIKRLVSRYGVSLAVVARRVVEAGIWECGIILWEPVYNEGSLVEIKAVNSWQTITSIVNNKPGSIPNKEESLIPGSPLYAFEKGKETKGKIPSPFNKGKGKYLAQSDIVYGQSKRIVTLLIPERLGWDVIVRAT